MISVSTKVAPPFRQAEFDIMFGKGISTSGDILDLAAGCSVVQKSGAWFAYEGEKIGQGRENAKKYLEEHPEICCKIEEKVRDHYRIDRSADQADDLDDAKVERANDEPASDDGNASGTPERTAVAS